MLYFHLFFQNYGSVCRRVIFTVFTLSDFSNQKKSDHVNEPLVGYLGSEYPKVEGGKDNVWKMKAATYRAFKKV